ncbi:hypothetical protein B0H14DRAFT_3483991 [Mycena olivaceomarginata]|nr:hypothetical protein B0H14DRAFT_3483991 [Mycena olivaceomarginata]
MPHKRAKQAIREQTAPSLARGRDLAPTRPGGGALSYELLPKAFARTMNAAQVRTEFRAKRKLREGDGQKKGLGQAGED